MKKILIAEDDPFIADIYASQLKKDGYAVDIANNGLMAIEKINHSQPDLLLLDLLLPKMDGWEVLKNLRNNPRSKDLKVVVISNLNEKDNAENITHFNVIKYLLKIQTTPEEISKTAREVIG